MGVLCNFTAYEESFDILGAVCLYRYIFSKNRIPGKSTLRRKKTESLELLSSPAFIGNSFDILSHTMTHFGIKYKLHFEHKCILTNTDSTCHWDPSILYLVTSSKTECLKLILAFSPLDIYYIPSALKKPKGAVDILTSYVTRLDEILGGCIEPDPLDCDEPIMVEIENKFKINIEIWEKTELPGDIFHYFRSYKGNKYEQTLKFHLVDGWDKLIFIRDENKYFSTFFQCPNKKFKCFYSTGHKPNYERHIKICQDPKILRETPVCSQKEFGLNLHPMSALKKMNIIQSEPKMTTFVFYDIESLCIKDERQVGKSEILSRNMTAQCKLILMKQNLISITLFLRRKINWRRVINQIVHI